MSEEPKVLATDRTCPACGALPYAKCTNPRGFPVSDHKARWIAAGIPKPTYEDVQANWAMRKRARG